MNRLKFTLLFYLCFFILSQGYGQRNDSTDYIPFPTSNAMWRERFGGIEVNCEDYQYLIIGDTIINGLIYSKIQKSGVVYTAGSFGCNYNISWEIKPHVVAYFRNDTSAKRVYLFEGDTDILIYDFSLSVGDTIPTLHNSNPPNYYTIESIDSIEIGGIYRKRFKIDNNGWEPYILYIIEGIGSTYGLFSDYLCPFESSSVLLCFSINENPIYSAEMSDCTPIYLGVEDYFQNKIIKSIYPNPTTGQLRIECRDGARPVSTDITIYNIMGQLLQSKIVNLQSEIILDVSPLPSGMYFLKIDNKTIKFSKE